MFWREGVNGLQAIVFISRRHLTSTIFYGFQYWIFQYFNIFNISIFNIEHSETFWLPLKEKGGGEQLCNSYWKKIFFSFNPVQSEISLEIGRGLGQGCHLQHENAISVIFYCGTEKHCVGNCNTLGPDCVGNPGLGSFPWYKSRTIKHVCPLHLWLFQEAIQKRTGAFNSKLTLREQKKNGLQPYKRDCRKPIKVSAWNKASNETILYGNFPIECSRAKSRSPSILSLWSLYGNLGEDEKKKQGLSLSKSGFS